MPRCRQDLWTAESFSGMTIRHAEITSISRATRELNGLRRKSYLFADREPRGEDATFRGDGQEDSGRLHLRDEQRHPSTAILAADAEHLHTGTARWNRSLLQFLRLIL